MIKKITLICTVLVVLSACQRPATISNWSPINDISTPGFTATPSIAAGKLEPTPSASIKTMQPATPLPTLDIDQLPDPLPESMKGYELYSWQVGEDWNFTLITGTNREKTFEELMTSDSAVSEDGFLKITVSSVDAIRQVLAMLPAKSEVFWSGMDLSDLVPEGTLYFSYPDATIKNDLITYCKSNDVSLKILVEPGK